MISHMMIHLFHSYHVKDKVSIYRKVNIIIVNKIFKLQYQITYDVSFISVITVHVVLQIPWVEKHNKLT